MNHQHNYVLCREEKYRDEDRNEYILRIYKCECGAGIAIPKNTTFISGEDYSNAKA